MNRKEFLDRYKALTGLFLHKLIENGQDQNNVGLNERIKPKVYLKGNRIRFFE